MQFTTVYTLTTDSDNGLMTSVHVLEACAWLTLIGQLIGTKGDLSPADESKRIEAMQVWKLCLQAPANFAPLQTWFEGYIAGSLDSFSIDPHDLPCAYDRDIRNVNENGAI